LYTAGANNKSWLYTGLEGGLTLVIDYRRKTARFLMFDLNTLEIVFENEFYRKFNIFYTNLSENFQCFEVAGGFIGFNIPDKHDAEKFFKVVSGLTDQTIARKAKDIKIINILDIKTNAKKMLTKLQEKLSEEYFFKENLGYEACLEFDFSHLERVFYSIEFDSKTKSFSVSGSDEEIKNLVMNIDGIKIKDEKGQRIADPKAYIAELYKNFQNTEKLLKKKEVEQPKVTKPIEIPVFKKETSTPAVKSFDKTDKNQKEISTKLAAVEQKKSENDYKNKPVKALETNSTNIPKTPEVPQVPSVPKAPGIPQVPSVPKAPGIPQVPSVPKAPGIPQVPSIPKAPGIPQVPSIPKPAPNNALLLAIQKAGENKTAILKKPPVINDRSAPIIIKNEISETNQNENKVDSNDGEQANNPMIKAPPLDMRSELKMRMANRMKKQENPTSEPKVNVNNNPHNNNDTTNIKNNITNTTNTINTNNNVKKETVEPKIHSVINSNSKPDSSVSNLTIPIENQSQGINCFIRKY